MLPRRGSAAGLLVMLLAVAASAADEPARVDLPAVGGPYPVGTMVWHWADPERPTGNATAREILAQLWYPAEAGGEPTRYRPLSGARYRHVRQNSTAGAAFSPGLKQARLIAFCPGRGTSRHAYTSLAEDLASRGYAVFAVDSPTIGYAEFPDGRVVEPSDAFRPSFELITGPYEKVDEFFEPAVELGLADLRFALDELAEVVENDSGNRLTGRIAFDRIGAFGHSLGGRICGALAGADKRVVALAAMEGIPPRAVRRNGMRASTLMLYSSELPEAMALPNIREVFEHRAAHATIIRLEGFGHHSVTDRPLLYPADYDYAVAPGRAIGITRTILASFFAAAFADTAFSPADLSAMPEVTVIATGAPQH